MSAATPAPAHGDSSPRRADYGLDAPGVVRNLFLVAAAGLVLVVLRAAGIWPGVVRFSLGGVKFVFPLVTMLEWTGAGCLAMGIWMIRSSRVGKVRDRERLLDAILWTGGESVLDIGCGRGLMLIGAAKRLTPGSGRAVGVDIWQAEDLSGNRPDATLENARLEGVSDRVEVKTADMRKLPFPAATFDVIVSSKAIHNIYSFAGRAEAIREIARVLKPGGRVLIDDIRHGVQYAAELSRAGCDDVRRLDSRAGSALLGLITFGSLRPATLLARKA
ncbi:MAG TPA: class I SAM-dependent methyltransferase [Thermoanaerobaculia bacterium]|jgi:SAM-dependent methyltransferase|nr:class I SAM-dependent methyltransferase [Thermoanaerobaculia bacterium]